MVKSLIYRTVCISAPGVPGDAGAARIRDTEGVRLPRVLLRFSLLPSPELLSGVRLVPAPMPAPATAVDV